ncbi:DUF6968 family protein [Nocardia terpenica]|uniref:DUF6968 family protein n=1 Tax=Nocardia terpenica TaxID=455432 RepID=UPI0012FD3044|nr:hypothetical protein [Nocardia terpenica]
MSGGVDKVIASRLVSEDCQTNKVEIGKPHPVDGGPTECIYRIDAHGPWTAQGTDELAALYAALTQVGQRLAWANRNSGRRQHLDAVLLGGKRCDASKVRRQPRHRRGPRYRAGHPGTAGEGSASG